MPGPEESSLMPLATDWSGDLGWKPAKDAPVCRTCIETKGHEEKPPLGHVGSLLREEGMAGRERFLGSTGIVLCLDFRPTRRESPPSQGEPKWWLTI